MVDGQMTKANNNRVRDHVLHPVVLECLLVCVSDSRMHLKSQQPQLRVDQGVAYDMSLVPHAECSLVCVR